MHKKFLLVTEHNVFGTATYLLVYFLGNA